MVLEGSSEALCPPPSLELRPSCNKSQPSPPLGSSSQLPDEVFPDDRETVTYGELIVLGHNGSLASGDKGRRRSRLALYKRPKANGVKPDVIHNISTPLVSKALSNKSQHSISYTLSRSHSVIVEYTHDTNTDMFQIGRSTESMIDFVVTDTSGGGGGCAGGEGGAGTRRQVEDVGRLDGWTDHQRRAGHAPGRRLCIRAGSGRLEGNFRLRQCLCAEGDPIGTAEGKIGGQRVQHPPGRLPDRPVRGYAAVADSQRPAPHTHPQAAGVPAPGAERRSAAVPRGLQHPGLPQPGPARNRGQETALGVRQLRPRARLPQLGLPQGEKPRWARGHGPGPHGREGVPHVQAGGTLRAAVAGLRGGLVSGRRSAHPCFLPLRPRLLPKDSGGMESDPAAARHARLPRRLPLLRDLVDGRAGTH
ncbi:uncharacterized protein peli3 isoform X3 [Syngnathus scovelli]|uniref:uncharacterized protein peli3 isoform X3 n=1 Tax=Syngnathus scovelli TaxID=161590 RepID=UPI00211025B0|nr:uncharacterized protein peli3 isoform X3 [Syngnathus scovelli]